MKARSGTRDKRERWRARGGRDGKPCCHSASLNVGDVKLAIYVADFYGLGYRGTSLGGSEEFPTVESPSECDENPTIAFSPVLQSCVQT